MKKRVIIGLMMLGLALVGCKGQQPESSQSTMEDTATKGSVIMMTNMTDDDSRNYIKKELSKVIQEENVERFIEQVNNFNHEVKNEGLNKGFENVTQPKYPFYENIYQDPDDTPMTNCRLNTYILLKNNLDIPKEGGDPSLLIFDKEAIDTGKVLSSDEANGFYYLFSKVNTEATKDPKVHAQKMKEHFSKVKFDDKVSMLSVVMHDNLDGDYLFIGHTGVLVPVEDGFLFVEKLAFEEPYQGIKFKTKEEAYDYLLNKYAINENQPIAQPFIMDNDELVKYKVE